MNRRPKAYESSALPLSYPAGIRVCGGKVDIPMAVALSKEKPGRWWRFGDEVQEVEESVDGWARMRKNGMMG